MQSKTKWILAIMTILALSIAMMAALGMSYLVKEYFEDIERREAESQIEYQAELERQSAMDPELEGQLDLLIAMEEGIKKRDALVATRDMSQKDFAALTDLEVIEIIAYELLPSEYVDWDAEMKKPIEERGITETLTAPKGHYGAGDFEKMPVSLERDIPLDALRDAALNSLTRLFAGRTLPGCAGDGADDYYTCQKNMLDMLATSRLQRPLYSGLAKLDPKSVSMIAERLLAIPPDAPMFEEDRTLAQVYRQLDGRVADYIEVRQAIAAHGDERALKAYREEHAHGLDDMIIFYDRFAQKIGSDDLNVVGFWLRRMDDGSAAVILDTLEKAQTRYAP